MSDNENNPLWSGRFEVSPAEAFERLNASISFDIRLAPYDIRGSIAHAEMLGEVGIVSEEESRELVRGLEAVLVEVEACLLYTSPSPRDRTRSRMPSSA